MHTDTTQIEKPTGSANYPAGHTDSASIPGAVIRIKAVLIGLATLLSVLVRGLV